MGTKAIVTFKPTAAFGRAKLIAYQLHKHLFFTEKEYLTKIEPDGKQALMNEMRKVYDEVVEVPYAE